MLLLFCSSNRWCFPAFKPSVRLATPSRGPRSLQRTKTLLPPSLLGCIIKQATLIISPTLPLLLRIIPRSGNLRESSPRIHGASHKDFASNREDAVVLVVFVLQRRWGRAPRSRCFRMRGLVAVGHRVVVDYAGERIGDAVLLGVTRKVG